jgi:hypothetical protein
LIAAVNAPSYVSAREAIIEKWVTYAKHKQIDEVIEWRLKVLDHRLDREASLLLKAKLEICCLKHEFTGKL